MWVLLKDVPVGERVFVRHFMGKEEVDGSKGVWAIVDGTRNKYAPDDLLMRATDDTPFFENEESYVWRNA